MVIVFSVLCSVRMPFQIMTSNYVNRFVPEKSIDSIYSVKMMTEYIGYTVGSLTYSILLTLFNDNLGQTNLTFILINFVPFLLATTFFLKHLFKTFNERQTIIIKEYTED